MHEPTHDGVVLVEAKALTEERVFVTEERFTLLGCSKEAEEFFRREGRIFFLRHQQFGPKQK